MMEANNLVKDNNRLNQVIAAMIDKDTLEMRITVLNELREIVMKSALLEEDDELRQRVELYELVTDIIDQMKMIYRIVKDESK